MSQIVEHSRSLTAALMGALLIALVGQCSAATLTVTSTSDSGSGSLREAINQANTDAGDTIQFNIAGSGPFTITLASQLPTITSKMSIVGGKSLEAGILISGNGSSRIMQISPRGTMTLQYLTFEDARSDGAGGAIFNSGNLTIQNSTFADNTAASGNFFADAIGGAIYTELSSTLTVTNSTFSHNTVVHSSGGRAFGGAIFGDDDSKLAITNCTFLDNSANGAIASGAGAIALLLASTLNLKGDINRGKGCTARPHSYDATKCPR